MYLGSTHTHTHTNTHIYMCVTHSQKIIEDLYYMNEIEDRSAWHKVIAMRRSSMKEQCGSRSPNSSYKSLLLYDQVQERLDKLLHQDPPSYNCIPMQEGLHYPEIETDNLHNNNKNSNTNIGSMARWVDKLS